MTGGVLSFGTVQKAQVLSAADMCLGSDSQWLPDSGLYAWTRIIPLRFQPVIWLPGGADDITSIEFVEWSPSPHTGGFTPRPQTRSSEPKSSPKLTEPHWNHCQKSPWSFPASLKNALKNHLMPPFQQEFSLSWGYKNWPLTHEEGRLSLAYQKALACCAPSVHIVSALCS